MKKIVYIICFTLIALFSPKLNFACTEHQEIPVETACETDNHHDAAEQHSCCADLDKDKTSHPDEQSTCGDVNSCCCPMMVNHSCCFYSNTLFEFHFHIPLNKEKVSTLLVFQETSGYSSIFIPPKIA